MTMDLDPAEDVPWTALIDGALELRERLRGMGLESYVKTTRRSKGLHVVVPLARKAGWDDVKAFAQGLAEAMAGDSPQRFVATMSKRVRKRTRNLYRLPAQRTRATAVAAYSTRARPGAAVSTPLAWEELSPSLRPNHYTVETFSTRLRHLRSKP